MNKHTPRNRATSGARNRQAANTRALNRRRDKIANASRKSQRGLAALLVLALISAVVGTGWAMVQPAAGTYSVVSDNGSLIRTDTRTGSMQRCHVAGTALTCETISAQQ